MQNRKSWIYEIAINCSFDKNIFKGFIEPRVQIRDFGTLSGNYGDKFTYFIYTGVWEFFSAANLKEY